MGRDRTRRDRARDLQRLRRSTRRHVPRGRCHARAHQHASRDHVGARLRAPAGHDPLRAPDRHVMARGDAAHSGKRPAVVHGAQPAVPDGQSVGVRHVHAADVHGARRSAYAGLPRRGASHRHGRGARRPRSRRRSDRARGAPRLRRVSAVRRQHLHVHRRLPALGERRWHGASQQHHPHLPVIHSGGPARSARHHRARVLSRVERRAHPAEVARAVQFRGSEHVGRAVARPRGSPATTVRSR